MSALFWIDIGFYSYATILSLSLTLVLFSVGPGKRQNQMFSIYLFLIAVMSVTAVTHKLLLFFGSSANSFFMYHSILALALLGPVLLLFTVIYVKMKGKALIIAAIAGIVFILGTSYTLFQGRIIANQYLDRYGIEYFDLTTTGKIGAFIPIAYFIVSFIVFFRYRTKTKEPLTIISAAVLATGFTMDGVIRFHFPVMALTTTLSVLIIGYALVKKQVLNPLKDYGLRLEREVSERTKELRVANSRLNALVEEKSILIREINHRFKNHMQQIMGFLSLGTGYGSPQPQQDFIREVEGRVRTISVIHEMLYEREDIRDIKLDDYANAIIDSVGRIYGASHRGLTVAARISPLKLQLNTMSNLGLIINELLTNSFKYAYEDDASEIEGKTIFVSFGITAGNRGELVVEDYGKGMPKENANEKHNSMGLKLVEVITTVSLDGVFVMEPSNPGRDRPGLRIKISFPLSKTEELGDS